MKPNNIKHCLNCLHCRPLDAAPGQPVTVGQKVGECRKNPPTPIYIPVNQGGQMSLQVMTAFPVVNATMDCDCFVSGTLRPTGDPSELKQLFLPL